MVNLPVFHRLVHAQLPSSVPDCCSLLVVLGGGGSGGGSGGALQPRSARSRGRTGWW